MIIEMLGYPDEEELEILSDFKDKDVLKRIGAGAQERFEKRFQYTHR